MENKLEFIIERLLGRKLQPEDGASTAGIAATEQKLGVQLAPVLQSFYRLAGKEETVMDVFQHFTPVEELFIEGDKLVFLEENQGVCVWGIALSETGNDQAAVYQCPYPEDKWYAEDDALTTFLETVLYYQFAQGGYEWQGGLYPGMDDKEIAAVLEDAQHWEIVVNQPGNLMIYWYQDTLIWYFPDKQGGVSETLIATSRTEEAWEYMEDRYDFKEL
ncbi:hypothetical protein HHL17_19805 [Chitinophaga sp. G-6-1-13]|uniref:SMI1/KNR4 family protein n=1 Tax=Chitinophaga fulva TaxID=2728842 RepID=A0A848GM40_9BACT|nr:hypothetical protein [Chitinophaga fulva]NML39456.1 hypothetical protein [Chitinophaga fulva]